MNLLYLDTPMGISGDMFLGALIDMGLDLKAIIREIKKLPVDEFQIKTGKVTRHSISATTFRVSVKETAHHRTFADIKRLINKSRLSPKVKDLSIAIFKTIAEAEGKTHNIPAEKVHFHEVGAMDSIIDIVGASVAVTSLKIDRVVSSPVPLGSGWTDTMHGRLPIPAPATLEILKGVPIAPSTAPFELTTPTGAAIIKTLTHEFGGVPSMTIEKTGYGAGKKDFEERANVLRVLSGKGGKKDRGKTEGKDELLTVMETNIDDMSPQIAGYLMERLFKVGALEVFFTPVQMKKSRPGTLLTVLSTPEKSERIMDEILDESTSIGVRFHEVRRRCLERAVKTVRTKYGSIRVKVSYRGDIPVNIQPEYEDCKGLAEKKGVPLKKVMDAARAAFQR